MMKQVLLSCLALNSLTAFAEMKYPFCEDSISVAPSEEGAISNNKLIRYTNKIPFELPQNIYRANRAFFRSLGHDCLGMSMIEIIATGEKFYLYTTKMDECDGGNTFGIMVSEASSRTVALINDGQIECK